MNEATLAARAYRTAADVSVSPNPTTVSWGAIFAGAAGAAALSLILLILGTGLGLSSVSPWASQGVGSTTLGFSTIAWLTFTQLAASGMGGYLAGRLRVRWAGTDPDEVYFRDTAHGFLAWAVASLATAALLTSTIGAIVGGGAKTAGALAGGAATTAAAAAPAGVTAMTKVAEGGGSYFVDSLFRRTAAAPDGAASASTTPTAPSADINPAVTAEAGRIFASAAADGSLLPDDARYLGQLVSQRTGLSPADAEKRVVDTFATMKTKAAAAEAAAHEAADKARKASAYAALWLFVSLLIGAFIASLTATYGGRQRDLF